MGTSTNYDAPPQWATLKGNVTRSGGQSIQPTKAAELIRDHIENNGGSRRIVSGGGVLGAGRTPQQVARSFAGFLSQVRDVGLTEALRQNGLQDLIGRPASELLLGIVNRCGGTNGSIDAADARSALARLMDKLLEQAESPQEVEAILSENANGTALADLLMNFFGYYVYEQFCRVFFEHLVKKHGEQSAESFLGDILEFIHAALRNHTVGMDVAAIEWFGAEGEKITSSIMQLTLEVFQR